MSMLYTPRKKSIETSTDASLGLVMRLNVLWSMADRKALAGDLDGWNFVLDRIYCNLLYRNPLQAVLDETGENIKDVKVNEDAERTYNIIREKVTTLKKLFKQAVKKKDRNLYAQKKDELYRLLMMKDVWLRKFMQELGLYLKEFEFNPATAMFGSGSR